MNINDTVMLQNTGDKLLDGQKGRLVGYHGEHFPIVLFDFIPSGYQPAICIISSCVKKFDS